MSKTHKIFVFVNYNLLYMIIIYSNISVISIQYIIYYFLE